MIFRNFFNKMKKQTRPKKMNLGVRIVELARELNCIYVTDDYLLENTSGIIFYSNKPYIQTHTLWYNLLKSNYAVVGYVKDEQFKLIFKNFYFLPDKEMTIERYYTDFDEFKQEYIKCINDYHKYLEEYLIKEANKDFK